MAVNPNTLRLQKLLKTGLGINASGGTMSGSTVKTTTLEVNGVQSINNNAGSYVKGLNNVVTNVAWTSGSEGNIKSGAIYIPKNAFITNITVAVTSNLAMSSSTLGVIAGTSTTNLTTPGNGEIIAGSVDSLCTADTALVRGKGTSTHGHLKTAYDGNATLTLVQDGQNYDSAGELHIWVSSSGGPVTRFTTGSVAFAAEFLYMGDTV